jgi:hypothetical protein
MVQVEDYTEQPQNGPPLTTFEDGMQVRHAYIFWLSRTGLIHCHYSVLISMRLLVLHHLTLSYIDVQKKRCLRDDYIIFVDQLMVERSVAVEKLASDSFSLIQNSRYHYVAQKLTLSWQSSFVDFNGKHWMADLRYFPREPYNGVLCLNNG